MKKNINIQEQDWELLARYLSGESSPEEEILIKKRIDEDDSFREEFEYLRTNWKNVDLYFKSHQFNDEKAWRRLKTKLNKPVRKTRIMTMMRVAAAILLVIGAGYLIYNFSSSYRNFNPRNMIVVTDSTEILRNIVLPDGSHVQLNISSKLSFPNTFTGSTREVTITGEAFFEVVHNPKMPFIIHAAGSKIKVLGTSFNVKAYSKTNIVEVIVKSGKVQFLHDDTLLQK
ncbi:MAG: FecR family protein, partial [Bacteroidota bacterium]|nr:FecR family protein [Bacteroidota bacterium]